MLNFVEFSGGAFLSDLWCGGVIWGIFLFYFILFFVCVN